MNTDGFMHYIVVIHKELTELSFFNEWDGMLLSSLMFHRLQLDTTARTWCSSTVLASWRLEGRKAGWVVSSTLQPNSAVCKHSTGCWHTDPGSSHSSTSRSDTTPTHALSLCSLFCSESVIISYWYHLILLITDLDCIWNFCLIDSLTSPCVNRHQFHPHHPKISNLVIISLHLCARCEVSSYTEHFCSFTANKCCRILQNKWSKWAC